MQGTERRPSATGCRGQGPRPEDGLPPRGEGLGPGSAPASSVKPAGGRAGGPAAAAPGWVASLPSAVVTCSHESPRRAGAVGVEHGTSEPRVRADAWLTASVARLLRRCPRGRARGAAGRGMDSPTAWTRPHAGEPTWQKPSPRATILIV